jgi:hypothetical protein
MSLGVHLDRFPLLDALRIQEKTWSVLAPRYGVSNPDPPWKSSLSAVCDCLDVSGALPTVERRRDEDGLSKVVYGDVPAPERQLLALVHTMLRRGLVDESALTRHMQVVRARLEAV